MSFTAIEYDALLTRLAALGEEEYRRFSEGLNPGTENQTMGVRIPQLRRIAKELCRGDWRAFLDSKPVRGSTVFEVVMLAGIVTASAPCPTDERLARTAAYIPRIRDWATNDTVCASYRIAPQERAVWREFLTPYLTCGSEFGERFALILLMDQFLGRDADPEDVGFVLYACSAARCPAYYTKMAVAWTLCSCFCRHREKTLDFLTGASGQALDDWTMNKAIRKCRESRLVSAADKAMLNTLKRSARRP